MAVNTAQSYSMAGVDLATVNRGCGCYEIFLKALIENKSVPFLYKPYLIAARFACALGLSLSINLLSLAEASPSGFISTQDSAAGVLAVKSVAVCDPNSEAFLPKQHSVPWVLLEPARVAESDYRGRIYEAVVVAESRILYAYKIFMNIRGFPSYAYAVVMEERVEVVGPKELSGKVAIRLKEAADKVTRNVSGREKAFVLLHRPKSEINIWGENGVLYFSIEDDGRFAVFEIDGREIGYVCTYFGEGVSLWHYPASIPITLLAIMKQTEMRKSNVQRMTRSG